MANVAIDLLRRMANEYDTTKINSFDSFFYIGVPDRVIETMVEDGLIVKKNDIVASICLTEKGYNLAKK